MVLGAFAVFFVGGLVNMLIILQHMNRASTVPIPSTTVYVTVCQARALLAARCSLLAGAAFEQQGSSRLRSDTADPRAVCIKQGDGRSQMNAPRTNKYYSSLPSSRADGIARIFSSDDYSAKLSAESVV